MICAEGMHGRFRLGYGAQYLHVAAAIAEHRAQIDRLVAEGADANARDAGADPEACDGHGQKPLDYAIDAVNAAFIDVALDAGADPAGSGDAFGEAQEAAWFSCPAFARTRAYKRLMLAGARPREGGGRGD